MYSIGDFKRVSLMRRLVALLLCLALLAAPAAAQDSLAAAAAAAADSMAEYNVNETDISFSNEGQTIIGTLAMPEGEGPFPAVLLLHGFTGMRHELPVIGTEDTMFSRAARWLGERGLATLRIDFRGSGESDGAWADTTFSGQISDALAALDYLEMLEGVDGGSISILGLSQGGLVGAGAAGRDTRVSNLVLWSAVSNPVMSYGILLGYDTLLNGVVAGDEALSITLPWGAETSLKRPFFEDIFLVDPVAEIAGYGGPLLAITGSRDTTVAPQPHAGQVFLDYHEGAEALVVLDGDHVFDVLVGDVTAVIDEALAYSLAWLQAN